MEKIKFNRESIKTLRINKGLSQEAFASKIDNSIKKQHVSQWENGKQVPSTSSLIKIANAFQVPFDLFFEKINYNCSNDILDPT
jgi:transcriptional regulator with XRE-family HTH domain